MAPNIYAKLPPDATILQLKQKIKKSKGFAVHQQALTYGTQELEDDKTLRHYNLVNQSQLKLQVFTRKGDCPCATCKRMKEKVTVNVKTIDGKIIKVEVTLEEPVEKLKNLIRKTEGIPISRQKLDFKGQELLDHKILDEYNLVDEENPNAEPDVNLLIEGGPPTLLEKFTSAVNFKGTNA